jgi:glycosyltransferase involved in cell wall biosynthesis
MDTSVRYSVIVPLYNEEGVVDECYKQLSAVMASTNEPYELVLINDGSEDRTVEMVKSICEKDPCVKFINFSRNFGHQIAITAGMDLAGGDAIVVIDADLQDPPAVILEMIEKWKQGYEVVYGKRAKRKGETIFKKLTAMMFYRFLASMTNTAIPTDVGDFRLIDRKVCDVMKLIREKNRFVRGLVSWIGFRQTDVIYVRDKRYAGVTKYPFVKMLRFATDAVISFSNTPLKLATYSGFLISGAGFGYMFYALYRHFVAAETVKGWTSLIILNLFFSGIILTILGIIGEYIGRIYNESKDRPLYILKELINFNSGDALNGSSPNHPKA